MNIVEVFALYTLTEDPTQQRSISGQHSPNTDPGYVNPMRPKMDAQLQVSSQSDPSLISPQQQHQQQQHQQQQQLQSGQQLPIVQQEQEIMQTQQQLQQPQGNYTDLLTHPTHIKLLNNKY